MSYRFIYLIRKCTSNFFLFLILNGCKHQEFVCCKENTYEESNDKLLSSVKVDSNIFAMRHFDQLTATYTPDFSFGIHHIYLHGKHYIVYLVNKRDSLILINPFDSLDTRKCAVNGTLKKQIPYNVTIQGGILHCIGDEEFIYKQLRIDSNLTEIMSVDLKKAVGSNPREFIYSNLVVDKSLAFVSPYLIIPFGDYKTKNNCGTNPWKIVNIVTKESFTAFDFPEKYRKCDLKYPDSIIEPGDSNEVYSAFPKYDKIYKFSVADRKIVNTSKDSVFPNRFLCFDEDLKLNMAYKDKYERTDENNENLIYNPVVKQIFLIKKLRKKTKNDATRCAILVFNNDLSQIGTYYTTAGFYPRLSYWYKEGVVITDSSFSKGYYYAFYR